MPVIPKNLFNPNLLTANCSGFEPSPASHELAIVKRWVRKPHEAGMAAVLTARRKKLSLVDCGS
ncbi:MAG: hypothetical protein RRC34_01380 [Lentisphaeria bacterium]|nr:hypothetical protein [Lentisphaeria bacterium]